MSNKTTGRILVIMDAQQISEKFIKRDFVIEPSGFIPGDEIEVSYNLRGREWTNPDGVVKYFNTLECWRIDRFEINIGREQNATTTPENQKPTQSAEDDDLPF